MHLYLNYLALSLPKPQMLSAQLLEAITQLAKERSADYALIKKGDTETFLFLHKPDGRLSFNSGIATIKRKLLDVPLKRIPLPNRDPFSFFRREFPQGIEPHAFIASFGDTFSPENINRMCTLTTRLMDPAIRLSALVESGEINMSDVPNIANARSHLKQEEQDFASENLPDLDGPLTIRYRKYVDGAPVPDGPYMDVTIEGRPNDLMAKRKHYWIYSGPGYGKTTTTRLEVVDKYKAAIVPHPKNAVNVPNTAQLLVIDEVGPTRKIPIEQLKGLTCGDASTSFLNRKFYGQSYVPRKDAQLIILSNLSPYNVYSNYRKGKDRRMESVDVQAMEERFHIIRLDGDNLEEKRRFVDVEVLTPYEFKETLYETLYDRNKMLNDSGLLTKVHVRDSMEACYKLYLDRLAYKKQNLSTEIFMLFMRSLVHEDDWPIYEEVHRDYGHVKGYFYNTRAVDETHIRLPACKRPPTHVPPTTLESIADPTGDEMVPEVDSTRFQVHIQPPLADPQTTKSLRPPPVPSTHCVYKEEEKEEEESDLYHPDNEEMEAMFQVDW